MGSKQNTMNAQAVFVLPDNMNVIAAVHGAYDADDMEFWHDGMLLPCEETDPKVVSDRSLGLTDKSRHRQTEIIAWRTKGEKYDLELNGEVDIKYPVYYEKV